ncbi:MAG: Glutathione S-transferase [uncultured Sphingosinicella sp.]|uniref:Glutathione S-transferase n=1 Tax=uncultured Sphingosinicella sp. TaxID=478748 RepID=A0A6J4U775_9SPHN|nr:glutathione S-transferase family protein [uncultured Sphingosinicella sp.]CAA9541747.1 MAG: Glutathione S-transferase [uncultured Sphingosinicella sp.]
MADITFYTNPMSRGQIARWMLEEVGQPYETVILDYGTTMKAPEYLAINPMGKVPAIKHGDTVVTEGAAICAYLADAFPDKQLAPPPGDPLRGAYYRWLFFGAGPVETAVTNNYLNWNPTPEQRMMVGYGSYSTVLDVLEQLVASAPYLLGDRFTALDVYLGSQIAWGIGFGTMEKRPGFEEYVARITDRPAYRKAKQIDQALMPKKEQQPA